ncbi:hypothetical protein K0M31_010422, partial [Melipona bicolor]
MPQFDYVSKLLSRKNNGMPTVLPYFSPNRNLPTRYARLKSTAVIECECLPSTLDRFLFLFLSLKDQRAEQK